jgi:hypothetical protein
LQPDLHAPQARQYSTALADQRLGIKEVNYGLQGSLVQVDEAEIVPNETDEPNAHREL